MVTTPPEHGGPYGASVGGNVGGNVVVGSHNVVHHTTIYQTGTPAAPPSPGVPRRLERRPERVVGRDDLLTELRDRLAAGSGVSVVALCGLGGMGKTTAAVEYTHRHHDDYPVIWHAHAETTTGLLADFHDLAVVLGVDTGTDPVAAVHAALAARGEPWLLVLDNVTDHAAARRFLPTHATGHVLVTTQDGTWPAAQRLDVPTLGLDAATMFLLDAAATTDHAAAARLAAALGLLPLALVQAAAYLRSSGLTFDEYLDLLDRQPVRLLDRGAPAAHADPVAATFNLALADLATTGPESVTLLRLLAFTASEDIPFRLLLDQPTPLPATVDPEVAAAITALCGERITIADAMTGLRRHSLVGPPTHTVTVHRLVQTIARHHLTDAQRGHWQAATASLITAAIPADVATRSAWPVCTLLLPHALIACDLTSPPVQRLANAVEWAGDYTTARTVWTAIARANTQRHGPEHPATLTNLADLAHATGRAGDAAGARDQYRALLSVRERVSGPEHPDTLTARINLANWTGYVGDAVGARDQYQALLPVQERVSGPEHLDTLTARADLAYWTGEAGDAAGARDRFQALLPVWERVSGHEHPYTLTARANIAYWTGEAGDAAGARDHYRALLPLRERVSGPEHPDTLIAYANLAHWTGEAGDAVGARDQFRALLPLRERVSGPEHPDTLTDRANLAHWTGEAGDAVGARDRFQELLPVWERVSGSDHPHTLTARANLAHWTSRAG